MWDNVQISPGHATSLMRGLSLREVRKWREVGSDEECSINNSDSHIQNEFTDDQLDVVSGKRAELVGKIRAASPKGECMMNEEILPRRAVLRGALAVDCGLF